MNGETVVELADKALVASVEKRRLLLMKLKLRPESCVYSGEMERGMQGRLCKEMPPYLGMDVEEVGC